MTSMSSVRRFRDGGGRHPDSVSGRRESPPLLEVRDLAVAYLGVVQALHGVSLKVHEGEVVAVLGANGAGKTTLLRAISGLVPGDRARITKGEILLGPKAIQRGQTRPDREAETHTLSSRWARYFSTPGRLSSSARPLFEASW